MSVEYSALDYVVGYFIDELTETSETHWTEESVASHIFEIERSDNLSENAIKTIVERLNKSDMLKHMDEDELRNRLEEVTKRFNGGSPKTVKLYMSIMGAIQGWER